MADLADRFWRTMHLRQEFELRAGGGLPQFLLTTAVVVASILYKIRAQRRRFMPSSYPLLEGPPADTSADATVGKQSNTDEPSPKSSAPSADTKDRTAQGPVSSPVQSMQNDVRGLVDKHFVFPRTTFAEGNELATPAATLTFHDLAPSTRDSLDAVTSVVDVHPTLELPVQTDTPFSTNLVEQIDTSLLAVSLHLFYTLVLLSLVLFTFYYSNKRRIRRALNFFYMLYFGTRMRVLAAIATPTPIGFGSPHYKSSDSVLQNEQHGKDLASVDDSSTPVATTTSCSSVTSHSSDNSLLPSVDDGGSPTVPLAQDALTMACLTELRETVLAGGPTCGRPSPGDVAPVQSDSSNTYSEYGLLLVSAQEDGIRDIPSPCPSSRNPGIAFDPFATPDLDKSRPDAVWGVMAPAQQLHTEDDVAACVERAQILDAVTVAVRSDSGSAPGTSLREELEDSHGSEQSGNPTAQTSIRRIIKVGSWNLADGTSVCIMASRPMLLPPETQSQSQPDDCPSSADEQLEEIPWVPEPGHVSDKVKTWERYGFLIRPAKPRVSPPEATDYQPLNGESEAVFYSPTVGGYLDFDLRERRRTSTNGSLQFITY
ncbi:hypothetical protein NM688_g7522 [Phlebia brevispora]|uniref:Uncharacterized protein n=1 Tax=Phlebia brevispora TaxID=194682 RepID=A0ACC1S4V1_9APHY|nr:hypothetical protein NM688_g7522 [Phlebia brevispora]